MTGEELNNGTKKIEIMEKAVKNFQKEIDDLNAKIKANKKDIDRQKVAIKKEKDPKKKETLEKALETLEEEKEQLKFEVNQKKNFVKNQDAGVKAEINAIIKSEPDLKKYILYTQGKEFDKNIGKYQKDINNIQNVEEALKPRDGADAKENKSRDDLKKSVEDYNKLKVHMEEIKKACKLAKVDLKTNTEYIKAQAEIKDAATKMEAKFNELKNQLPINSFINYSDFKGIIDKNPIGMTIEEGLASQTKIAQKNLNNNKTALEGIIKEGKDMEVNFTGFSNYKPEAQNALVPQMPKRSFWYKLRHPILWNQEKKTAISAQIEAKEKADRESKYKSYDTSNYNLDDLKNVKFIKDRIKEEQPTRIQEAEKKNAETEKEDEER